LEPGHSAAARDQTLASYLQQHGYSDAFRRHYLLPMCAAVWSVPNSQVGRSAGAGGQGWHKQRRRSLGSPTAAQSGDRGSVLHVHFHSQVT
jgi:hypothetical protein